MPMIWRYRTADRFLFSPLKRIENLLCNLIDVFPESMVQSDYCLQAVFIEMFCHEYDKISRHNTIFPKHSVDFSGLAIFRHTITLCGSCAAFFYVCRTLYSCLQTAIRKEILNERYIYERKAGLSADLIHGDANGYFHARKFSVQYCG